MLESISQSRTFESRGSDLLPIFYMFLTAFVLLIYIMRSI